MAGGRVQVVREGGLGFVGFLAFIGALVYFLQHPNGFWGVMLGIGEAIVWPAILVFHVLRVLGA
ncbi:hypothetical protein [Amnibacterium sp.]|uniref:hypothetical protein n=1 Tax=Amnibacterium sp. TaxID=1872496 RepID=UPI003F7B4AA7